MSEQSGPFSGGGSVRRAFSLGICYVLGTFNDNFFKQGALLLALAAGNTSFPAWATVLFSLPFALFSVWAGWLADRFPKKNLVMGAKTLELAAMLAGAWGLLAMNWAGLAAMLFCMGLSSTLFSPALNGSIPELFPIRLVPRINALFKLATTASILLGISLAGIVLDMNVFLTEHASSLPPGIPLLAFGVVGVALLGLCCSPLIPRRPAAAANTPFPRLALLEAPSQLRELGQDRPLFLAVWGEVFFYFLSSLLLLEINALGELELGFSHSATSLMPAALLAGICLGSLFASRGTPESWMNWLVPSCVGIGLLLCLVACVSFLPQSMQHLFLFVVYVCAGSCGGFYLIPLTSFIQVRPAPDRKGRVLGLDNCLVFSGIMLAGPAYYALSFFSPSTGHIVLGALALLAALYFALAIGALEERKKMCVCAVRRAGPLYAVLAGFVRACLGLRYRVTVRGLKELDAADDGRPIFFLASHPALTDPVILSALLWRYRPRPLSDEGQGGRPVIRQIISIVHPIYIPDVGNTGRDDRRKAAQAVREGLRRAAAALRDGDCVLLYPSGRLTSDGLEHLGSNGGTWHVLEEAPECRLVLIRTRGLWGSSFSRWGSRWGSRKNVGEGEPLPTPDFFVAFFRAMRDLLLNCVVFMPRRNVRIYMKEIPRSRSAGGDASSLLRDRKSLNRMLEHFFNARDESGDMSMDTENLSPVPPEETPRYFWLASGRKRR